MALLSIYTRCFDPPAGLSLWCAKVGMSPDDHTVGGGRNSTAHGSYNRRSICRVSAATLISGVK
jgi:hypothetical protein